MNTFSKALKYATTIFLFTILFGVLTNLITNKDLFEFEKHYPVIFIHFFATPFIAIYFYTKHTVDNPKKTLKTVIKSSLLIFTFTYLAIYVFLLLTRKEDFSLLNIVSFFNGILSVIIFVFSRLIYYLKTNRPVSEKDYTNVSLPINNVVLISLGVSLLYVFIVSILGNGFKLSFWLLYFFTTGLFTSFIMYVSILHIKKRSLNTYKRNGILLSVYIINTFLISILIPLYRILFQEGSASKIMQHLITAGPFYLMCTLSIHTYFIYLANKKEKEELKQVGITASLKYLQLKAQLSPHFLFNNISVLTALIEENQGKAVKFSENLSNVYRYFLEQEKQDLVSLKDELAFASEYLGLLKVRYEKALNIGNNAINNKEPYFILPMALQQVFENVIKHNEVSIENPINIEITINEDYLLITNNKNPKIGMENNLQTGIDNIMNRYAFFTDEKVIITENELNYTIELPLLKIED